MQIQDFVSGDIIYASNCGIVPTPMGTGKRQQKF